jgi:hypothetical protein
MTVAADMAVAVAAEPAEVQAYRVDVQVADCTCGGCRMR